jgi:hypothetical protein
MSVARVSEITALSKESFDDAVKQGVDRANASLRHIQSAWVKDMRVEVENGKVTGYQVNMQVTFLLEDTI